MIDSLFVCLPVGIVTDTHPTVLHFDWFACRHNANCIRVGHGFEYRNCVYIFENICLWHSVLLAATCCAVRQDPSGNQKPTFVFKTILISKGLFQEVYTIKRLLLNQLQMTIRNRNRNTLSFLLLRVVNLPSKTSTKVCCSKIEPQNERHLIQDFLTIFASNFVSITNAVCKVTSYIVTSHYNCAQSHLKRTN